jgi:CCR4-NOT transcription complex subunit 3
LSLRSAPKRNGATFIKMATNRKLQAEIDRTLKRIQEGIEEFDEIWQKVHSAPKANLKEKYEAELKKEIKKLQRYRDQVKTWASSSEIKNKQPLVDARKLIEKDMERFRVFEKEAKTKQYSTEGLANRTLKELEEAHQEYDPEIDEMIEWIDQIKERIQALSSKLEEESQQFSGTKKKKQTASDKEKFNALQKKIDRFQWHIAQLNDVADKLNEGRISVKSLKTVKDDVEFWVEKQESEEEDQDEEDDEYFYDVLKEQLLSPQQKNDALSGGDEDVHDEEYDDADDNEDDVKEDLSLRKASSVEPEVLSIAKKPAKEDTSSRKSSSIDAEQPVIIARKPAAVSVPAKIEEVDRKEPEKENKSSKAPLQPRQVDSSATVKQVNSPSKAEEVVKEVSHEPSVAPKPAIKPFSAIVKKGSESLAPVSTPDQSSFQVPDSSKSFDSVRIPQATSIAPSAAKPSFPSAASVVSGGASNLPGLGSSGAFNQRNIQIARRPEEKVNDFKNAIEPPKSKWTFGQAASSTVASVPLPRSKPKIPREYDAELMKEHRMCLEMLDSSLRTMPPIESDRSKAYTPRNPYRTPESFPVAPAKVLDEKSTFEKLDIDTLFFIFYFQQGTYQQYLAAQQLKKQSWRFHTKYLTWFQRHEDPKLTTDEFEQGTYVYFDYDYSWCQRIKTDFTFEYAFLEDELQI